MAILRADVSSVRQYERKLEAFADRGAQFAQMQTTNEIAGRTHTRAVDAVGSQFINRTPYTRGSIRMHRADTRTLEAEVGSYAPYLRDQELGATGGPTNVPTPVASGENPRAKVRRKAVRRPNRMNAINIKGKRPNTGNRKQDNIVAVKEAAESKSRYVFQDRGRKKGIYRVTGGVRKTRIRLVQDLTRDRRVVKPKPWLQPLLSSSHDQAAAIHKRNVLRQLARRNF